jgi:hypothetical protein
MFHREDGEKKKQGIQMKQAEEIHIKMLLS